MNQRVPLPWLRVYDELRRLGHMQRRVQLAQVREICERHGMPHAGLSIEDELTAMLSFFHSLNAILWYDLPSMRDLVILDPRWVLDAATCFIRDFKLKDHTQRNERFAELDQDAMRREPDAWSLLTDGSATLQRPLLNLLWQHDDFEPHKTELLDLLTRFGLLAPVPRKADAWIVPALLPASRSARPEPPFGWPPRAPDAARLLLRFSLCAEYDDFLKLSTLVHEPADDSAAAGGFLPLGVFHRLCTGALGCSNQSAGGAELALERKFAYVAFDTELLVLQHLPELSSIAVFLHSNGQKTGGAVLDRLRVLVAQELGEYRNLRCRILAAYAPADAGAAATTTWIDLDVLAQTPPSLSPEPVTLSGGVEQASVAELHAALGVWQTTHCDFYFLDAAKIAAASDEELPRMLPFHQLQATHKDWLIKKRLTLGDACRRAYTAEYLAVSHRWEAIREPDGRGVQMREVKAYLRRTPGVKYVFVDVMCMPLPPHTSPLQRAELTLMLPNVGLLYLGCSVLMLLDASYSGRFWFGYELWLSLQTASTAGLAATSEAQRRCTLVPLEGTPPLLATEMLAAWRKLSSDQAYYRLSQPELLVSNASDREVVLAKLLQLLEIVPNAMAAGTAVVAGAPTPPPPVVAPAVLAVSPPPATRVPVAAQLEELDELKKMFGRAPGSGPSTAAAAAAAPPPPSEVEGLRELLDAVKLSDSYDAAGAWCKDAGVDSLAELREAGMEEELVGVLALKPAKAKILLKRIKGGDTTGR